MKNLSLHLPSVLVGLSLAGLVGLTMAQQVIGTPAVEVIRVVEPQKILGVPAPDEWMDIESNPVGQPATTFEVPTGHRLTVTSLALSTRFPQNAPNQKNMSMRVAINGSLFFEKTGDPGTQISLAASNHWVVVAGTVMNAGDVLTVERFDDGNTIGNPADPSHTFALRGFLEEVD